MPRIIPAGHRFWPDNYPLTLSPDQIKTAYEQGCAGAWKDPEEREKLKDEVESRGFSFDFLDVINTYNFGADDIADKLIIPFRVAEHVFPGCWPGAAQQVGDCVSQSQKNGCLTTIAGEIAFATPDEQTGAVEVKPEIPEEGIKQGAFSSESIYWYRGYNGHGWSCDAAANVVIKHGILVRKNYTELGVDLTTYSGSKASMYGARAPSGALDAEIGKHGFRTAAELRTLEEIAVACYRCFGVSSCGGEGYSSTNDENGVSRRSGRWAHAMAIIGVDLRKSIIAKYGEPLILILNSWGLWNGGGRRILGTNIDIPRGAFWVRWSEAKNRDYHVVSGNKGWVREKFQPYHLGIAG